MKLIIQKLPLDGETSFVARTYRTPDFEVPWHQHIEYELITFTEGFGLSFVGNDVRDFETGDVFFLGSNLPHTFQKGDKDKITSAVVVQFRDDFWGSQFLELPECQSIRQVLSVARQGIKLNKKNSTRLHPLLVSLEHTTGFHRIINLCNCLLLIATGDDYERLATQEVNELNFRNRDRIDAIFQYTIDSFQQPITLDSVAQRAGMSVPAFCTYFKKTTKKTYINFLNEIRISYACKLLLNSTQSVTSICYESGFSTLANFNKQFLKIKGRTPSQYRKSYIKAAL